MDDPHVAELLALGRLEPPPDAAGLGSYRVAIAETRVTLDAAVDTMKRAERAAIDRLLEQTEGGERGLGPNEDTRRRVKENAVADDEAYQLAAAAWQASRALLTRLEAYYENALDARRDERLRAQRYLADALLVSAGALAAPVDDALIETLADRVSLRLAGQLGGARAASAETNTAVARASQPGSYDTRR